MKKLITLILFFVFLSVGAQKQTKYSENTIKKTKISLFGALGGFTAKMSFYEKYQTMFFVSTENQQFFNKISKFSLNNREMNLLYDLLLKKNAKKNESHKINTLEKNGFVKITYKIIGKKSYGILRFYENEYDKKGSKLSSMSNRNYKILFGKHKKTNN